jgi:hypothetical protein
MGYVFLKIKRRACCFTWAEFRGFIGGRAMQHIKIRSIVVTGGILAALVVMPTMPAHAGSEGNITNPGSSSSAAPAASAAQSAAPASHAEKRKHAGTAGRSARRADQSSEQAPAPASGHAPLGVSIGVGGVTFGF